MERIRLVLIDDHVLFREGLSRLLASEPDIEVVGLCANTAEALEILRNSIADLILLDFNLGPERGTDLIAAVRRAGYSGKILMVTAEMDASESVAALQAGAGGVFMKHNSSVALTKAIRMVAAGGVWLDRRIMKLLAESIDPKESGRFGVPLSKREDLVLQGILQGGTNRRISEDLGVSEGAVKSTVQQLFRKSGVRTRSQLVRTVIEGRTTRASEER